MDKIKVYLDTNTVHDFFVNQAIALKRKEGLKIPEKLKFFLESRENVEFITSVATEAEISRELVAGYGLDDGCDKPNYQKPRYTSDFFKEISKLPQIIKERLAC